MFKKNTAVTGFTFHLRSASDGSDTTTGTPVGYVTLDGGTQTAIGDVTPVHEGNGEWSVDLTAGEMNGDIVSLAFVLAGSITADFKIKTTTLTTDDTLATDVISISGDSTAADNLELQYDGTGITDDTFPATQAQVGNLATGSAAISVQAESDTVTTGTEVNTFAVTDEIDGVYHEISDVAGALEMYYQFDIGGNGVASSVQMTGRLNGANDTIGVFAYNWAGTAWEQIGSLAGTNSTTDSVEIFNLLNKHTGTGANLGKVRVRGYAASGLTSATLYMDQAFVSYAVVAQSVGYDGGQVWVDTGDGTAGTESYVNGVADNPVLTLADAITIASNIGLHRFYVSNESTITFAESHVNEVWTSNGGTMVLGSQDISSTHLYHWNDITGAGTSATGEVHIIDSHIANSVSCTLGQAHITRCNIGAGGLVLSQAGNYLIEDSSSGIAGAAAPVIDMGAAVGATNLSVRKWAGGLTINNLASGDVVTLDGTFGTITLNGADASVELRGIAKQVVNNLTGSPTVNDDTVKADDIAALPLATDIVSSGAITTSAGAVANVDLVDVCTTNTDMRGTDSANTTAPDNASIAAILVDTADMQPRIGTMETDINNLDLGIIYGTAATGTLTTTSATTNLTGYVDNQLVGAYIIVTSGSAEGERREITAYTEIGGVIEFAAMTIAMANNDTFKIV